MDENKLGWVVEVGNFVRLQQALSDISSSGKTNIHQLKEHVITSSNKAFDLNKQIKNLISEKVF